MRPITPVDEFEEACKRANLNNKEQKIIDHIRYVGVFTQPSLTKDLKLDSKPPVLSLPVSYTHLTLPTKRIV